MSAEQFKEHLKLSFSERMRQARAAKRGAKPAIENKPPIEKKPEKPPGLLVRMDAKLDAIHALVKTPPEVVFEVTERDDAGRVKAFKVGP